METCSKLLRNKESDGGFLDFLNLIWSIFYLIDLTERTFTGPTRANISGGGVWYGSRIYPKNVCQRAIDMGTQAINICRKHVPIELF